jgi:Ca2+-binding EF-hand superfamily protein
MELPAQASFMSEASSIMRPEEQLSSGSLAKRREDNRSYFRSIQARRSRPMLSSISMPSLATSSLSTPVQADLRVSAQRDADTAINELNHYNRRFVEHGSRGSLAEARHGSPMRYGMADVMDALVDMEQPCPPQRAAHLVSVYGRGHSGLLSREQMQELLQDATGASRMHKELLVAWTCVGLNRKKTPPPAYPPPAGLYRPLSQLRKAHQPLPSMHTSSPQRLLAVYRTNRAEKALTSEAKMTNAEVATNPRHDHHAATDKHRVPTEKLPKCKARLDSTRPLVGQISDMVKTQMRDVLQQFREWDEDGSGAISFVEFERAMSSLGLKASIQIKKLWNSMDTDGNGEIAYEELLTALDPPKKALAPIEYTDGAREDVAGQLKIRSTASIVAPKTQLVEAFDEIATSRVMDVFSSWDLDGDGVISRFEFGKAMSAKGMETTKKEVMMLFNSIDTDQNGFIEYKELHRVLNEDRMGPAARQ